MRSKRKNNATHRKIVQDTIPGKKGLLCDRGQRSVLCHVSARCDGLLPCSRFKLKKCLFLFFLRCVRFFRKQLSFHVFKIFDPLVISDFPFFCIFFFFMKNILISLVFVVFDVLDFVIFHMFLDFFFLFFL